MKDLITKRDSIRLALEKELGYDIDHIEWRFSVDDTVSYESVYHGGIDLFLYYRLGDETYYTVVTSFIDIADTMDIQSSIVADSFNRDYGSCTFTDLPLNVNENIIFNLMFEYIEALALNIEVITQLDSVSYWFKNDFLRSLYQNKLTFLLYFIFTLFISLYS